MNEAVDEGAPIELADVTWAGGAISLVFDDDGRRRTCRLPPVASAALIKRLAQQMRLAGALVATEATGLTLRPPAPPSTRMVLGLQLKDWPELGVSLDWSQLRGLSQAAWAALAAAPPKK